MRAKEQGALSPPTGDSRGTQGLMAAGDSHLGASGLRPAVGLLVDLIRDPTGQPHPLLQVDKTTCDFFRGGWGRRLK